MSIIYFVGLSLFLYNENLISTTKKSLQGSIHGQFLSVIPYKTGAPSKLTESVFVNLEGAMEPIPSLADRYDNPICRTGPPGYTGCGGIDSSESIPG